MQLTMGQTVALGRLIKAAQTISYEPESDDAQAQRRKPSRSHLKAMMRAAYPDYGKSMVSQRRKDPHVAGLERGVGTGVTGAVLGALIASVLSKRRDAALMGALAGGALAGIPGYVSGRAEAKSDYTKLLALRRLGINSPAEYEQAVKFPSLTKRITAPGERI